jgi:hypothetical protein
MRATITEADLETIVRGAIAARLIRVLGGALCKRIEETRCSPIGVRVLGGCTKAAADATSVLSRVSQPVTTRFLKDVGALLSDAKDSLGKIGCSVKDEHVECIRREVAEHPGYSPRGFDRALQGAGLRPYPWDWRASTGPGHLRLCEGASQTQCIVPFAAGVVPLRPPFRPEAIRNRFVQAHLDLVLDGARRLLESSDPEDVRFARKGLADLVTDLKTIRAFAQGTDAEALGARIDRFQALATRG